MEQFGFARAGVPGEYSPTVVSATLATDLTSDANSAVYTDVVSVNVTIESVGEVLVIVFSATARKSVGAGGAEFRVKVDGVAVTGCASGGPSGGARQGYYINFPMTGLAIGTHTVTVDFRIANCHIDPVTNPNGDHATLICFRNRPTSDREMDGVPMRGWPMIYSLGTQSTYLTSTKTSTSATISDSLLSLQYYSRYAQSALLIRFSASGDQPDAGAERSAKFQLYVDGQAVYGTGDGTGTGGFAGVTFNAALMAVVPVQAGIHNIEVLWSGSSVGSGLQIDPSLSYAHGAITVEEVFCEDVQMLSDMEGYVATNFASKNLPRVGFKALKSDLTGTTAEQTILSKLFYVTGENSALQVEVTGSIESQGGNSFNLRLYVDGVLKVGAQQEENNTFLCSEGLSVVVPACAGNHLIEVRWLEDATTFACGTHPEYCHANLLVREVVL